MVNPRTYRLRQSLAARDDLPDEALPAVIEALRTPADIYQAPANGEDWCKRALKEVLPVLLRRVVAPAPRERLLEQADGQRVAGLAEEGLVTAADVPAILKARRVTPDLVIGLARHRDRVSTAIGLLPRLNAHELAWVVDHWDPRVHRTRQPVPPIPRKLFDAVLKQSLMPLVTALRAPEPTGDVTRSPDLHKTVKPAPRARRVEHGRTAQRLDRHGCRIQLPDAYDGEPSSAIPSSGMARECAPVPSHTGGSAFSTIRSGRRVRSGWRGGRDSRARTNILRRGTAPVLAVNRQRASPI